MVKNKNRVNRAIIENTLVGTCMGLLVGLFLRHIFPRLNEINLDWVIFILIGLSLGLLSGFERKRIGSLIKKKASLEDEIKKSKVSLLSIEERYKNLHQPV